MHKPIGPAPRGESRLGSDQTDTAPTIESLGDDELRALGEDLDTRVRHGSATLEDFGTLARVREVLAERRKGRLVRTDPATSL